VSFEMLGIEPKATFDVVLFGPKWITCCSKMEVLDTRTGQGLTESSLGETLST